VIQVRWKGTDGGVVVCCCCCFGCSCEWEVMWVMVLGATRIVLSIAVVLG
jgi:hypothetical protein